MPDFSIFRILKGRQVVNAKFVPGLPADKKLLPQLLLSDIQQSRPVF